VHGESVATDDMLSSLDGSSVGLEIFRNFERFRISPYLVDRVLVDQQDDDDSCICNVFNVDRMFPAILRFAAWVLAYLEHLRAVLNNQDMFGSRQDCSHHISPPCE
jgi:hypothetical protein